MEISLAPDTALAIIAGNLASLSIIIVYHMFAIQEWSQRVQLLEDESIRLSFTTAPSSLERRDVERRLEVVRNGFPLAQIVLLGFAVLSLAGLGVVAAVNVSSDVALVLTLPPLIVLPAVYCISSFLAFASGRKNLDEASGYLGRGATNRQSH